MASICNDPNGHRRILFVAPDGRRKTIRLGKCDRKTAESVCRHVEALLAARIAGQPVPRATATWLASLGTVLRDKLAAVGLAEAANSRPPTLGAFLDELFALRQAELKPSTMTVLRQARRWLERFLDPATRLDAITPQDADRVRALLLEGRAKATANKWTRLMKEFFAAAVRRGLISANPFGHIRGLAVVGDRSRRVFIPADEVRRVLEVIPCPQFRLLVTLARWGGLRIPSEAAGLRWSDIDLPRGRMVIHAPKTAHHADGGVRIVPIFPEVRQALEELWETLPEGSSDAVITRYPSVANLRTQLARWCLTAGIKPWLKPFQNMRATRATELADQFPSHVCASWLGHSERIADQFYRSVTDEHFARAVRGVSEHSSSGAKSGAVVAQNPAQQGDARKSTEVQDSP